jgi:hypothetical protein
MPSTPLKTTGKFSLQHQNFLRKEQFMENDQPTDAVELVRAIRNQHYEETKHMTREEFRAHTEKRYAEAKERMTQLKKEINPNDYDFSWLRKK